MAGLDLCRARIDYANLLIVSSHCMLRIIEGLSLMVGMVALSNKFLGVEGLPHTKGMRRTDSYESVTVNEAVKEAWLWSAIKVLTAGARSLRGSPHEFGRFFNGVVDFFGLSDFGFQPYSWRRGGATHDFNTHGRIDSTLFLKRGSSLKTGRIYITDGWLHCRGCNSALRART